MKILLVAGHGEGDCGAVGNGCQEADLTREVVGKLYDKLKDIYDVTVYNTTKNLYKQRKNGLNFDFSKYNLIVEIHFNSFKGKSSGCEVEIHAKTKAKAVDINVLSNLAALGFKNRGTNPRSDLSNINAAYKQGVNYCYIETCFIDSKSDMDLYKKSKNLVASAIANGIVEAYGKMKSTVELTEVNDIVWEYEHRGIITEKKKWIDKLKNDKDAYWLARKALQFIRKNNL